MSNTLKSPKSRHSRNHLERLTFRNGKFILEEASTPKLRTKLNNDRYWQNIGNDAYETDNLGAAAAYRHFAETKVEKIFKRTFQEHYAKPWLPPLPKLDHHQWVGLEWILTRKRSYLAHAPGAGKTWQAILGACLAQGKGQSIFIVPPSLTKNWEREIWRATEMVDIFPTIGMVGRSEKKEQVAWNADFIICPDSMLTKEWVHERLIKIEKKFIAVDEASRFKDPKADRSLAFYGGRNEGASYKNLFQTARHVVFLDGSPMPNRPIELWAPTYALHPEAIDCMGMDDFGYRYCGAKPNDRGVWEYLYSSNESELKAKLKKDFMHVVTENELSHPERRRSMVILSDDVRSHHHKEWERKNLTPELMTEAMSQGEVAHFRKELGIRKVAWVSRYIRERLEEKNESILVFAWHREVCEMLQMELAKWKPGLIYGGVCSTYREDLIESFQEGKLKVLIMNIAAAGRGHNLQRADRVIFAEWSWTDELNRQCEKRASRKGSEKSFVRCEYLVCPNSMDEMVLKSVFSKERRVQKVIG